MYVTGDSVVGIGFGGIDTRGFLVLERGKKALGDGIGSYPTELLEHKAMANKKVVFVAFPLEDQVIRDMLNGQSLNTRCPIELIDMSVKKAYD